ncbi:MAG: AmmeMemoRadiSam system radical SAM enzyme [candidate division NC10 bacterium]|nr:AmmeMemoRadiSam system radical SAM enzyme [candidate division NC10 bacterium]
MKEAAFYEKLEEGRAHCHLCPHECRIKEKGYGICRTRRVEDGVLYAINYAQVASMAYDPIEKKPLYHFYPGSTIFSMGGNGCNLGCLFCQNWEISQSEVPTRRVEPEKAIELAQRNGSIGIAYTYSEPLVWLEYVLDCAKLARGKGLKNVLVTNGLINPEPLQMLLPWIDALNIDVKSMSEEFYKKVCKGPLSPVLHTAEVASRSCLVEITNLVIPTLNDSDEDFRRLVDWIAEKLGADTPLHFSRYFPHYRMQIHSTPQETLMRAWETAKEKLSYVYVGNLLDQASNSTYCPHCHHLLIGRDGYRIFKLGFQDGKCGNCGQAVRIMGP